MAGRSRAGTVTTSATPRDRDEAGKPKNARPRDGLGRPLDRAAAGEPTMPADLRLAPGDALPLAQRLIDDGRPFHAHEVLEIAWKSVPSDERQVWKGLAQIAVGLTHARRGNGVGATTLLRRGAAAVAGYAGKLPAGLDITVVRSADELADRIERSGLDQVTDEDLRPRLFVARGAGPTGTARSRRERCGPDQA
ncbi:MAG TPA: DUF309 domain-containing protein [Streptosporangiaceae bacterium]|nr:DUF309 domain-containing protein [Streptosporangiaceae bacterium]